jgi:hypothetical protein
VQNYYYCHEENGERKFIGEHGLGKLEGLAMPMLKQMRTHNFTLNNDDRLTFAGYIATAHTRVPSFERSLNSTNAFMHAKG